MLGVKYSEHCPLRNVKERKLVQENSFFVRISLESRSPSHHICLRVFYRICCDQKHATLRLEPIWLFPRTLAIICWSLWKWFAIRYIRSVSQSSFGQFFSWTLEWIGILNDFFDIIPGRASAQAERLISANERDSLIWLSARWAISHSETWDRSIISLEKLRLLCR